MACVVCSSATSPFVKPSGSAFAVGGQKYYVSGTNFFNAIQNDSYTEAEVTAQLVAHWNNGARHVPYPDPAIRSVPGYHTSSRSACSSGSIIITCQQKLRFPPISKSCKPCIRALRSVRAWWCALCRTHCLPLPAERRSSTISPKAFSSVHGFGLVLWIQSLTHKTQGSGFVCLNNRTTLCCNYAGRCGFLATLMASEHLATHRRHTQSSRRLASLTKPLCSTTTSSLTSARRCAL